MPLQDSSWMSLMLAHVTCCALLLGPRGHGPMCMNTVWGLNFWVSVSSRSESMTVDSISGLPHLGSCDPSQPWETQMNGLDLTTCPPSISVENKNKSKTNSYPLSFNSFRKKTFIFWADSTTSLSQAHWQYETILDKFYLNLLSIIPKHLIFYSIFSNVIIYLSQHSLFCYTYFLVNMLLLN